MSDTDNATRLAEALNNHQVTDEEGQIEAEQPAQEEPAPQEEATVEFDATAEKSVDEVSLPKEEPKSENEPEMVETASDETGKRYVPEARFKEVYAKWKEAERKAKEQGRTPPKEPVRVPTPQAALPKTELLEVEMLKSTMPQFDPASKEYDRDIDEMGADIYNSANGTITRLEAARRAVSRVKKITTKLANAKIEARTVKAQQSDQGITSRVLNREGEKLDPNKMSLDEKEAWLKANGLW